MSKPFDLENAKTGAPVQTRDGHSARIICWDAIMEHCQTKQPIIALIKESNGDEELRAYTVFGKYYADESDDHPYDLVMAPVKKRGWINIYRFNDGYVITGVSVFMSADAACNSAKRGRPYHATIEIEWEE